jgi:arginase
MECEQGMTKKQLTIIGVMTYLGSGWRGTDSGPSGLRAAGLNARLTGLGYEVVDAGNISTPNVEALAVIDPKCRYMPEIVHSSQQLAVPVETTMEKGLVPVVLGSDHSVAVGTITGLAFYHRKRNRLIRDAGTRGQRPKFWFSTASGPSTGDGVAASSQQ